MEDPACVQLEAPVETVGTREVNAVTVVVAVRVPCIIRVLKVALALGEGVVGAELEIVCTVLYAQFSAIGPAHPLA